MKIFVVAAAGRQVAGDAFLHTVEAVFRSATEAEAYVTARGKVLLQVLPTDTGDVECVVQRTVYPLDLPEK